MKWFKHDSNAHSDVKLQKLMIRYGLKGYGLYFYCLEQIASNVDNDNLTFELEDDAEVLSFRTNLHQDDVQEMMTYMVDLGLFENDAGTITCWKLAQRLDQSMTSAPKIKKMIKDARKESGLLEGYVYFIRGIRGDEKRVKIGHSINPWARINDLKSHEHYGKYELDLVATIKIPDRYEAEKMLHESFKSSRIELEWFRLDNQILELINAIKNKSIKTYDELLRHVVVSLEENRREENRREEHKSMGKTQKRLTVPYQEIVDLYHEKLPHNPQVVKLTDNRKRQIKARHVNNVKSLDDWSKYFDIVSDSKFLTGQQPAGYGRSRPFVADIDFLIKEANLIKIVEGRYHE